MSRSWSGARMIKDYAQLTRASNLPTCVSNVLVGGALASDGTPMSWPPVLASGVAICLLYMAALAMNDAFDAGHDRVERPQRPIPSGRISQRGAYTFAGVATAVGLFILAFVSVTAFALGVILVAAAIGYNITHKFSAWSVLLVGVCRGLIYVIATVMVLEGQVTQHSVTAMALAGILALYTAGITFVARAENASQIDARRWLAIALPIVVLVTPLLLTARLGLHAPIWQWEVPVVLMVAGWLVHCALLIFRQPPRMRQAVMNWLSGICLIDAYFLTLLDRPALSLMAVGCFVATVWAHRYVEGT